MGKATLRFGLFLLLFSGVMGCGGTTSVRDHPPSPDVQKAASEYTSTEQLILGESFDGALVVHFEHAASSAIAEVREIAAAHGVELQRLTEAPPEEVDRRREELEYLSGKRLPDMNYFYRVEIADQEAALQLYRELKESRGIERLYPRTKTSPTSLTGTPDFSGMTGAIPQSNLQGYLYPLSTHGGLNVIAVWNRGVRGDGVLLVENESGFFTNHEDLPLRPNNNTIYGAICDEMSSSPWCPQAVAHGAAMMGILSGGNNRHGVTGIASDSNVLGAGTAGGPGSALWNLTDGQGGEIPAGSLFSIAYQIPGPLDDDGFCSGELERQRGCIPAAADAFAFAAIEQATAAGVTVIVGSGNGSINLDQDAAYYSWQENLNTTDTSAILVGGSNGRAGREKWIASNTGRQVSLFAWAQGVVTTSYNPFGPTSAEPCSPTTAPSGFVNAYAWNGTTPPVPANDQATNCYTDSFGGTSSATAMIAGVAALLQSHAKTQMATNGNPRTRYLMPDRIKQLLVASGTPQTGGGGNIGVQPDTGVALTRFDTFWMQVQQQYPELTNNTPLTEARWLQLRQQAGVGLQCWRSDERRIFDRATGQWVTRESDPSCPEIVLWPSNNDVAKTLDFDGDGRADLVSSKNGEWKLDLSGTPSTTGASDNFGSWDVTVRFPRITGTMGVWPYTEDINADGRSDIVMYDKEHATWHLKFTDFAMLDNASWSGWDRIIDYSATGVGDTREMDPWRSQYCRPHPGDYDGDGLTDLAIACSDGVWRIAYNTESHWENITQGSWDREFVYLDADRLREAPGWAYITSAPNFYTDRAVLVIYKIPDTLPESGRVVSLMPPDFNPNLFWDDGVLPAMFGGNEMVPMFLKHANAVEGTSYFAFKSSRSGDWIMADFNANFNQSLVSPPPSNVYGGNTCHPAVGDFDGDNREDRAVMCPDEWRIAYTGGEYESDMNSDDVRYVPLQYQLTEFALPGRSYSGGISYAQSLQLIDLARQLHPNDPPPIPVDMVTSNVCLFPQLCE